jgi:integrase
MAKSPKPRKHIVTVFVKDAPITLTLHPPGGRRTSWYMYWPGLTSSRSTGRAEQKAAVTAAEAMVRQFVEAGTGHRVTPADLGLTDAEFEAVQRHHYGRKRDAAAKARADKTLDECLDAIAAFHAITQLDRVTAATPDDCARFQREALTRPKNWRAQHPKSKKTDATVSPNTVLKWSRMLQAAFDRVNRNAGRKCVRGVVPEGKLLAANPWSQFTWIEGADRPIRQFDPTELLSLLDHLETKWKAVPAGALAAKVFLWSCCRKLEVAGLRWDMVRVVGSEVHFEVVGKWGVERWFRLPPALYAELEARRTDSAFVFGGYTAQIRAAHADNLGCQRKIRDEFAAANFGRWVYERVKEWALEAGRPAYLHVFRKTGLQFAHDGAAAGVSGSVAADAGVSETVLLGHYVKPNLRDQSNRTYRRLLASLPPAVATRYGYAEDARTRLERELEAARAACEWGRVAELAKALGEATTSSNPPAA